jgi:hypothetical protein
MFGFPSKPKDSNPRATPRVECLEDRTTPTLIANPDFYSVPVGQVLTIPFTQGVLANDFSDNPQFQNLRLTAGLFRGATYVGNARPLPLPNLFLNPDGGFTFIAPSANAIPPGVTQVTFSYTLNNGGAEATAIGVVTINLLARGPHFIATGADAGGGPHVRVFEAGTSLLAYNFFPYEPSFTGGVRVAVGDLNGDGIDDIATIPGDGGAPRVRVFSGKDGSPMVDTFAFDPAFRGGGYVAIGDFTGDGVPDLIVTAGFGGGPRVQVFTLFNNATHQISPAGQLFTAADFFAYDPTMTGGVRVAAGDVNGDGVSEIVTAPGPGSQANVRVFSSQQVIGPTGQNPVAVPTLSFFVPNASTDGVFVATGKLGSAGGEDIIVGTGSGTGAGTVDIFDGRTGALNRSFAVPAGLTPTGGGTATGPATTNFGPPQNGVLLSPTTTPNSLVPVSPGSAGLVGSSLFGIQGGVRVAAVDWNGTGIDDIVTGAGPGQVPMVRIFDSTSGTELTDILAYQSTFLGGVNVGAH